MLFYEKAGVGGGGPCSGTPDLCTNTNDASSTADFKRTVTFTGTQVTGPTIKVTWAPEFTNTITGFDKICCHEDGDTHGATIVSIVTYTLDVCAQDSETFTMQDLIVQQDEPGDAANCDTAVEPDCWDVTPGPKRTNWPELSLICGCNDPRVVTTAISFQHVVTHDTAEDRISFRKNSSLEAKLTSEALECGLQ